MGKVEVKKVYHGVWWIHYHKETLGMGKNHIHLLSGALLKISPGRIVRIFKNITARETFRRHPEIKKRVIG